MKKLTGSQEKALEEISKKLNVKKKYLFALIYFESKFNPVAENKLTHAKGLIQFMPSTARAMGYADQYDLVYSYPTIESQLKGPVYDYLKKYKPFPTPQSLFMSVFYPKARYWPSFKLFPKGVRRYNPGINTPGDYTRKVFASVNLPHLPVMLIAGGLILYITLKKKGGNNAKN